MHEHIIDEDLLQDVIQTCKEQGFATRNDISSIDDRNWSENVQGILISRDIDWISYTTQNLDNFRDYSGIFYDNSFFTIIEARRYLLENILKNDSLY